ncbi:hypothetical protein NW762_008817 [Fusarium torreyae]|uniref:Oxidoreductase acuF-like C2H2 type zinc-finger domain-containing protein n=1 Tax=Fusarium torreyae TaxID=1237075 RepID=A0A9W8RXS3_9HYPO|nr:hypothetical protein NW762_008817 [Fusarium torreyae]
MEEPSGQRAHSSASDIPVIPDVPSPSAARNHPREKSLVARLCCESLDVFQAIIKLFKASIYVAIFEEKALISFRRSLDRLQLWSDDYGICAGRQDANLAKSTSLRRATLKILISISEILFENSGTDYGSDNILEISEDLKTDTLCLMELGPMFESPALDSIVEQYVSEIGPSTKALPDLYKERMRLWFPKAHDSLLSRLSKAAVGRYWRCQQIREYGTSSPEGLSTAERFRSPEGIMDHMTDIPPLPERAKQGEPFICFACGQVVCLTTDEAWKRHVYQDLPPWQCLEDECPFTSVFQAQEDWVAHLDYEHKFALGSVAFECPLCLNSTGPGEGSDRLHLNHLSNHLEKISLMSLPSQSHKGFVFQPLGKKSSTKGASRKKPYSAPKLIIEDEGIGSDEE